MCPFADTENRALPVAAVYEIDSAITWASPVNSPRSRSSARATSAPPLTYAALIAPPLKPEGVSRNTVAGPPDGSILQNFPPLQ